ncbi:MAG: hypothetical protein AAF645_19025 [Myxococcota bacterium]
MTRAFLLLCILSACGSTPETPPSESSATSGSEDVEAPTAGASEASIPGGCACNPDESGDAYGQDCDSETPRVEGESLEHYCSRALSDPCGQGNGYNECMLYEGNLDPTLEEMEEIEQQNEAETVDI